MLLGPLPLPKIPRDVLLTARACPVEIKPLPDGLLVKCATVHKLALDEQLVAEAILAKYFTRAAIFEFLAPRVATSAAASEEWFLSVVHKVAVG